jgi:2-methylaconitate cis-trans-isomerase PrpF
MPVQRALKASLIRGGTSKGLYINENQLPSDLNKRSKLISRLFGSPDKRQIDGIGGADILTSKVCIIGPSTREDADIDYTFGQVSIEKPSVSYENNCGNLSPGAAVICDTGRICPHNRTGHYCACAQYHSQQILIAQVPIVDGEPAVDGDYAIDGVPGTVQKLSWIILRRQVVQR